MCGIIAVIRRRNQRTAPSVDQVHTPLVGLAARLEGAAGDLGELTGSLEVAATSLEESDRLLRGVAGLRCMLADPGAVHLLAATLDEITSAIAVVEHALESTTGDSMALEEASALLLRVKDAAWAIAKDRLRTAQAVAKLAGRDATDAALEVYHSVQVALSGIDRLEVRGRDSAGLHLMVHGHGLDLTDPTLAAAIDARCDGLFRHGAVRAAGDVLSFTYKAAAEIGELGDNSAALRAAIAADDLLRRAVSGPDAEVTVLGHTRWASVGIISQANCHPLNSEQDGEITGRTAVGASYVVGALNGDVDNYADLKVSDGLRIAAEITTDAKVIPTLVRRRLDEGLDPAEAFRRSVASFEGSVAVGANTAADPATLLFALRGSGQALYVGLAEDSYVIASEPYGLVEQTSTYLRMDGETPANPDNPTASRGQVLALDGAQAGTVAGIHRSAYDGTELPVQDHDLVTAQITTRDIDRGDFSHFLLKEITEAPVSFRKTLRGKLVGDGADVRVTLGDEVLPVEVRADLATGSIRRVLSIGQGTAAIAGQAFASALQTMAPDLDLRVEATLATELSGFGMRDDMSDTLVVAISQSGTTTDTNRTVDVVRARGARVIAIVNRRNSDLTDKADGVLYTSDGRDVEMSVASTKALYAQVAAGFVLAAAIAAECGVEVDPEALAALRALPAAMDQVVASRPQIAAAAQQLAPSRRYWAMVGNGTNRIAAAELRIKLSELCYKAIACDATEDKKHIDLSSEPLIIVCAAGLHGSTADDVAKEVAIYRAHKAAPIVIATEGEDRFHAALHVLRVPEAHPALGFVLSMMAGHLFGYEAALAIDAQAVPLRAARAAIEEVSSGGGSGDDIGRALRQHFEPVANQFFDGVRSGAYDGHLEASTAVRLSMLLRYALGVIPLDSYQIDFGKIGTPAVVLDDLTDALTVAIEQLTRPVDTIKHQAKTVTVGISRSDETLLQVPLAAAVLAAGAPRDALSYKVLRTLADLDPAVIEVVGSTRYRIDGPPGQDPTPAYVVDKRGVAADIPSRVEREGILRGTKHTVAMERELFVTRGRGDGRPIIIIPEVKDNQTVGLTVLHARFADHLDPSVARSVLQSYRHRYAALHDAVTETEPTFRSDVLAHQPVLDLLTLPIAALADRWRQ